MNEYELRKIRGHRYAKVLNGQVIGIASIGEVRCYKLRRTFPEIDAGDIEVALALTGVIGLVASSQIELSFKILAALGFVLGFTASANLFWGYVLVRIPFTWTNYLEFRRKTSLRLNIQLWLIGFYPWLLLRMVFWLNNVSLDENVEFGYLSLLGAFFLMALVAITYITASF